MTPASVVRPTAAGLRALSHPTRLKILMRLRLDGPATSTTLAAHLGLNTGATSYHLRQLAEQGFIEEDTERGDARDRWWKASHESTHTGIAARPPEETEDVEAYLQTVALMYTETLMQAVAESAHLPEAWQQASTISDWSLRLTPSRAVELVERLVGVIGDFAEDEAEDSAEEGASGSASFVVNLNAFPRPGTVVLEADR